MLPLLLLLQVTLRCTTVTSVERVPRRVARVEASVPAQLPRALQGRVRERVIRSSVGVASQVGAKKAGLTVSRGEKLRVPRAGGRRAARAAAVPRFARGSTMACEELALLLLLCRAATCAGRQIGVS